MGKPLRLFFNWHKEIPADTQSLGSAGRPLRSDQLGCPQMGEPELELAVVELLGARFALFAFLRAVACSLLRFIASRLSNDALDTARPDARSTSRLALQNPSSALELGQDGRLVKLDALVELIWRQLDPGRPRAGALT